MRDRCLLFGLLATVLAGCGHGEARVAAKAEAEAGELPVLKAAVLRIEPRPWPEIIKTQGSLIADEVTIVGAKVAGRVADVTVDLGDSVAADAPLATLDQEEFQLQISLAEAQLGQSRAALGLKEADPVQSLNPENAPPVREAKAVWDEIRARIERTRALAARNAVTQDELDQAISEEGVAGARYSAAINGVREKIALIGVRGAELSLAKQRISDTRVFAPFAGLVKERHVGRGSYLQVGDPVVTLVRTSTLRFRGTIPERHAFRLASGQQVTLRIEALDQPLILSITRISPGVDEMNRSLVFEAEVPNDDGSLRAGLFAEAEVIVDSGAQALAVPHSALIEFAGVEKVWKLIDGVAQEQPVQTARRSAGGVEITGGLSAGDAILTDGAAGRVARIDPLPANATASGLVESINVESNTAESDPATDSADQPLLRSAE